VFENIRSILEIVKYCCVLVLAMAVMASAEDITPRVGSIEIYGTRKVSVQKIRLAAAIKEGDPLPSREDVEDRIDKVPGVLASRVEATCCTGGNMIVYVGVEERNQPHFEFHPAPRGDVSLPPELVDHYRTFLDAVSDSIRGKNADEDLTNGYSLMADPECRRLQQAFIPFAERDLALLDRVLRESADSEQRTMAAYLLQYAPRNPRAARVMINALQYALQDQEDNVRENAMRSLRAVAVGAKLHPEQQIHIEPTWFIELMNSVVWSDRHNATLALVNLTDKGDPDTLALIRERALPSVIEMARWHNLQDALPSFILAGRLAGLDEKEIQDAWISGNREPILQQAMNPKKKRGTSKKQLAGS
jgi:hypothetical protein